MRSARLALDRSSSGAARVLLCAAAGLAFALVATLNSGGYRYGASDQAFYIPAVLKHLDPVRFPRDWSLLETQARYFLVDEIIALGVRTLGGSVEAWLLGGYLATVALLFAALTALGTAVFRSPLAVAAFVTAGTLRHRITKTGVNTFEGYFHPRVLVFALGVLAIVFYLRGRVWWALGLVIIGGVLHPSTAAFFLVLIGVAAWVTDRSARPGLASIAAVLAVALGWLLVGGPWRGALTLMDPEWRALLAAKDYLFPLETWQPSAWFVNAGTAAIAIAGLSARVRAGVAHPRERGLLAGAIALAALFIVTLPGVALGSVLLVQLQISRVFWLLELLALVPVVWWLVDRPAMRPQRRWAAVAVVGLVAAGSVTRGVWASWVEHRGEVFSPTLASTDWTRALGWIARHAPPDAHVLADPGHAWKYGYDVRFVGHDVYLEDVKDTSMALYSRSAADRVIQRIRDLGSFDQLTAPRAQALAEKYDLDYLITTASLDLPLATAQGPFRVYRLQH